MTRCAARIGSAHEAGRVLRALRNGAFHGIEPGRFRRRSLPGATIAVEDERWELLESIVSEVRRSLANPANPDGEASVDVCVCLLKHLASSPGVCTSSQAAARR